MPKYGVGYKWYYSATHLIFAKFEPDLNIAGNNSISSLDVSWGPCWTPKESLPSKSKGRGAKIDHAHFYFKRMAKKYEISIFEHPCHVRYQNRGFWGRWIDSRNQFYSKV